MARRRPAGRPGRRRPARSPPRARSSSGCCSSSGRGRPRRKSAGDGGDGSARETSRGLGRRCRRPGRPLRSSAERSACSCSSLCRSSFPMRGHRRRDARHRRSPHRRAPRRRDGLRRAAVARRRLGGRTAPARAGRSRRPSSARAARRRAVVPDAAARVGSASGGRSQTWSPSETRGLLSSARTRAWRSRSARSSSRAPDETPTEFTARVLRVLGASAAAASDLTGLFEIARFSDHPMDEDDRRRAIASVRVEAEVALR